MKIKRLKLNNFAMFNDFELVFNKQITRLVGVNGSGKTTVGLNSIWACFKGIAEKGKNVLIGERFRFIGKDSKSAIIDILLVDEKTDAKYEIKRKITPTSNQISFEPSELSGIITKNYIENLFNTVFLSAKHFCSLSGKEQAISLGIDTSSFDSELSDVKEDAKGIRRDLKAMGEITEVLEVSKVSISELLKDRDDKSNHNLEQNELTSNMNSYIKEEEIVKNEIDLLNNKLANIILLKSDIPSPKSLYDLTEIDQEIVNSEQINIKAQRYQDYLMRKDIHNSSEIKLNQNLVKQGSISTEKSNYIKSFEFNIKDLSVNEDGELTLKEKPIRDPYFSKGELEMIVARLAASQNPELKVRFIDDFDTLDESNQEKLIKNLLKAGFQLITAEVGDKVVKNNSVLLRECKVVERSNK